MSMPPSMYVTHIPHPIEDLCSICHEEILTGPIAGHQVRVLSTPPNCSLEQKIFHIFHKSCLDRWLSSQTSPSCPLCRVQITQISTQLEDLYVLIGIGNLEDIEKFLFEQKMQTEEIEMAMQKALQYKKMDIASYFLQNCQMSQLFIDALLIVSIEKFFFAIAHWIIKNKTIAKETRELCILKICQIPKLSYPENIYLKMLRNLLQQGPIDQDIHDRSIEHAKEHNHTSFVNLLLQ